MEPQDTSLTQDSLKKQLHQQLKGPVLGSVKSHLRAQLLQQLQKQQLVQLSSTQPQSLLCKALNSMLVEYFGSAPYPYSLSVFSEESGNGPQPTLSESEVLSVLKVDPKSLLHQAYVKSKDEAAKENQHVPCVLVHLLQAVAEVAREDRGLASSTQTASGSDKYNLDLKLQQLEQQYQSKLRTQGGGQPAGLEEKLAWYRSQIEQQAKADLARQVERIREVEVAGVRLEEAAKWRRALEGERHELERVHSERLAKLRSREEELAEKLRRQQREVETAAFDHRQRLLREEERLRTWKHETQALLDTREDQLKHQVKQVELRERAISAREASAEGKASEATQALATAHVKARAEVEKEYLELKASLSQERLQLELDRARLVELRNEAAAEVAAARAKEDRLRALETARAEAEARAATHAAESEILRLQVERLHSELSLAREEVSRKVALAADNADAMLSNAAGALGMLEKEAVHQRGAVARLRATEIQLEETRAVCDRENAARLAAEAARDDAQARCAALQEQVQELTMRLQQMSELVEEVLAARDASVREAEDATWRADHLQQELTDLKRTLTATREEAMALRAHSAGLTAPGLAARGVTPPLTAGSRLAADLAAPRRPATGLADLRASADAAAAAARAVPRTAESAAWLSGVPRVDVGGSQVLSLSPRNHLVNTVTYTAMNPAHTGGYPTLSAGMGGGGGGGTGTRVGSSREAAAAAASPIRERMKRLSEAEAAVASEVSSFRKRVAEHREASARELQLVMTRVAMSSPNSARTSMAGDAGGLTSPVLSRSPSARILSASQSVRSSYAAPPTHTAPPHAAPLHTDTHTTQPAYEPQTRVDTAPTVAATLVATAAVAPQLPTGQVMVAQHALPAVTALVREPVQVHTGRLTDSQGGFRVLQTGPVDTQAHTQGHTQAPAAVRQVAVSDAPHQGSLSFSDLTPPPPQALVAAPQQSQSARALPPLPPAAPVAKTTDAVAVQAPAAAAAATAAVPAGLMLVSEFSGGNASGSARVSGGGGGAVEPQGATGAATHRDTNTHDASEGVNEESNNTRRTLVVASSLEDVKQAQAAKLRMLQEQRNALLAAQRAEEEQRSREEAELSARVRASAGQGQGHHSDADSHTHSDNEGSVYEDDFTQIEDSELMSPPVTATGSRGAVVTTRGSGVGVGGGDESDEEGSVRSSRGSSGDPARRAQRPAVSAALSGTHSSTAHQDTHTGGEGLGGRLSSLTEGDTKGKSNSYEEEDVTLETAGRDHNGARYGRRAGGASDELSPPPAPPVPVSSSDESLPSGLGDLALSIGDDSGLEVGLDEESEESVVLGGTALGGSSDSVF